MSIYSCYLVTRAALTQFNLPQIPDQWFNWHYKPTGNGASVTLRRIEIVESSQSDRVQEWYTQVTEAGLASTLIRTTDEDDAAFPLTALDPWGGGADLYLGLMIPGDKSKVAGWINHLSQPDELAVLEWLDHRLGGGGDCNRYFNRVPNFAHCYANELKRWIACEGNAELLADQWDDVRGWPEDTPSLTVDDFAWDRGAPFDNLWTVPMRRLPFCEIGFDKLASCSSTNGLLPDDRQEGRWLFDLEGKVEAELKRLAYASDMTLETVRNADRLAEPVGGMPRQDGLWRGSANVTFALWMTSTTQARGGSQHALMGAKADDQDAAFTLDLGAYFGDATLFPNTAKQVGEEWKGAKLTIQRPPRETTSVAFEALDVPQGWALRVNLAQIATPLLLNTGNEYWAKLTTAPGIRLRDLIGNIEAQRVPAAT